MDRPRLLLRCALILLGLTLAGAPASLAQKGIAVTGAAPSAGQPRITLVIGNAAYEHAPHLRNPVHDARAMAAKLRALGFAVTERENLKGVDLQVVIDQFGASLGAGAVGLFYYSGHGAQIGGRNYLIPVDAQLSDTSHLKYTSVPAQHVLDDMRAAGNPINLVILDACRNTPVLAGSRGLSSGLAQMSAARGTLVAYATSPGETAQDGSGNHSPYTAALLQHLGDRGVVVEQVLKRVGREVAQSTDDEQTPWFNSSVYGNFYLAGATASVIAAPAPPPAPAPSAEQAAWDSIKDSTDPQDFTDFLGLYPTGTYAGAAKLREERLRRERLRQTVQAQPSPQQAAISTGPGSRTFRDPTTGMEFVYVPGGTFTQGCVVDQSACYDDEKPTRRVTLSPFWLAKTEVTQGQWKTVMGNNPSNLKTGDNYPVEQVSWKDAQAFIRRLSAQSGQHYRLPTEAEWEYACRAGGKDVEYGTRSGELNPSLANYGNHVGRTTPVHKYPPNGLGLYDMSGNVWQWVQDVYQKDAYRSGAVTDPLNDSYGAYRVARGGGWGDLPRVVRCSLRDWFFPGGRSDLLGFRLARTP